MNWTIYETDQNVHVIEFDSMTVGEERYVLLGSDDHWDSKDCDRDLLAKHMEEAEALGAPVLRFGDIFDCMGGKWDKRSSKDKLRPELAVPDYLSALPKQAAEWYAEYPNLALLTYGNHETAIIKKHEVDLLKLMTDDLNSRGVGVQLGGYWGFVRFRFPRKGGRTSSCEKTLFYHHGYGGGGAVTTGLIDNSRTRDDYLADIYYSGHIHRRNMDERVLTRLGPKGAIRRDTTFFLRGSAYKCEHKPMGFHVENGRAARPLGGWWLKFTLRRDQQDGIDRTYVDVTPSPAQ